MAKSYEVRKVYPIVLEEDVPLAVAGGAGDADLRAVEEAVGRIEEAIMGKVGELRARDVEPDFSMVLASVDVKGRASIYVFNERGLVEPVHDNPGFALLGRGLFTGGALLLNLPGYAAKESYALDLGLFSIFVIDVVSEGTQRWALRGGELVHEGRGGQGRLGPPQGGGFEGVQGEV